MQGKETLAAIPVCVEEKIACVACDVVVCGRVNIWPAVVACCDVCCALLCPAVDFFSLTTTISARMMMLDGSLLLSSLRLRGLSKTTYSPRLCEALASNFIPEQ